MKYMNNILWYYILFTCKIISNIFDPGTLTILNIFLVCVNIMGKYFIFTKWTIIRNFIHFYSKGGGVLFP